MSGNSSRRTLFVPLCVLNNLVLEDDKGNKIFIPIKGSANFLEGVLLVYNSPKPLKATNTPYVELSILDDFIFDTPEKAEEYKQKQLKKVMNGEILKQEDTLKDIIK